MLVLRKIIAALLVLASLGIAACGVQLCIDQSQQETVVTPDADAEATQTLEGFFSCLRARNWDGAYSYLYNYSSLGLETPPEEEISRMFWDAQLAVWDFSVAEGYERSGSRVEKSATIRRLDLYAISDVIGDEVQSLLAEQVEKAHILADVYNDDGSYREDVAYAALLEATADVLQDTAPYQYDQTVTMVLNQVDDRWLIEADAALISALTSGAVRR